MTKYKIPQKLEDIKLYHLELISMMNLENDKDQRLKEVAVLLDIDFEELYNLPINDLKQIIIDISWFFNLKPEDIKVNTEFEYANEKYNIQVEYSKLTGGQLIDIETFYKTYTNEWTLAKHIIALCMYKNGDETSYSKTPDEFNKRLEIANELGLDIVYGFLGFFLNKRKNLKEVSQLISIVKESNQNLDTITQTSKENMDWLTQFGNYLGIILFNLIVCLGYLHQTFILPCKSIWKKMKLKLK